MSKPLRLKTDPSLQLEGINKSLVYWKNVIEHPHSVREGNRLVFTVDGMKNHAERMVRNLEVEKEKFEKMLKDNSSKKPWEAPTVTTYKLPQ